MSRPFLARSLNLATYILVVIGTSFVLLACDGVVRGDGCPNAFTNGCTKPSFVPCLGGQCVDVSKGGTPNFCNPNANAFQCTDGTQNDPIPTIFASITVTTAWSNCTKDITQTNGCSDACRVCGNVYVFNSTPCNTASKCNPATLTLQACGPPVGAAKSCMASQ